MQVNTNATIHGDVLRQEQVGHTQNNKNGTVVRYTETTTTLVRQNRAKTGNMKRLGPAVMTMMLNVAGDTHKSTALGKLIAETRGGKTGNIAYDSKGKPLNKSIAEWLGCSAPVASKVLKWLIESGMVVKIGKYKLMTNPYEILPNQLGSDAVAQLQAHWDDNPTEVIEWLEKEDIDQITREHTDLLVESRKEQIVLEKQATAEANKQDQHAYENIHLATPILEIMLKKHELQDITPSHLRHYINKTGKMDGVLTLHTDRPTQKLLMDYTIQQNSQLQ